MCAPMTVPMLKPQTPTVRPHPDFAAAVVVTPPLSTPPLQPLKTPPTRNNPPPPTYSPPSSESVDGTSWCHKWVVAQVGSTEKCWCTTSGVQSNSLCGSTTRVWRKWWRKLVVVATCWCTKFGVNNFVAAPPWFGASGGVRGRWRK